MTRSLYFSGSHLPTVNHASCSNTFPVSISNFRAKDNHNSSSSWYEGTRLSASWRWQIPHIETEWAWKCILHHLHLTFLLICAERCCHHCSLNGPIWASLWAFSSLYICFVYVNCFGHSANKSLSEKAVFPMAISFLPSAYHHTFIWVLPFLKSQVSCRNQGLPRAMTLLLPPWHLLMGLSPQNGSFPAGGLLKSGVCEETQQKKTYLRNFLSVYLHLHTFRFCWTPTVSSKDALVYKQPNSYTLQLIQQETSCQSEYS